MKLSDFGPKYEIIKPTKAVCCPINFRNAVDSQLKDTAVIVVTEIPEGPDVKAGKLGQGTGGKLLRQSLKRAGLRNVSWTTLVRCSGEKGKPPPKCYQACQNRLYNEIRGYPFVLLVGSAAAGALFPGTRVNHLRGNMAIHPDFPGQRFYACYHPSWAYGRGDEEKDVYFTQINRFAKIVEGDDVEMEIHRDLPSAKAALHEAKRISFDIETDSLESWRPEGRIRSAAFTHNGEDVFFSHETDPNWPAYMEAVCAFLEDRDKQVVGHHVGFDLEWMERRYEVKVRARILDTGVLYHHCCGYKMPSLKLLTPDILDGYRYLCVNPGTVGDVDALARYNGEDVIHTWHLFEKGIKQLDKKQLDLYLTIAAPSDLYTQRITANGIHVRTEHWEYARAHLEAERGRAIQEWGLRDPKFTEAVLSGDKALEHYLFNVHKLPVIGKTKTGKPQMDKAALKAWVEQGATFLEPLLEVRRVEKMLSTFVLGLETHIQPDGRVHAGYLNTWTDSGRLSSRSPNMQNQSRDKLIRDLFGAPDGYVFIDADYSQIELRVMFSCCNDPTAIKAYMQGSDVHAATALAMAGESWTKDDRTKAKAINFALLYGGEEYTLQQSAKALYGVDFSDLEAKRFTSVFFGTYRRLKPYHEEIVSALKRNRGWVQSITGHKHAYVDWDHPQKSLREHAERSAINAHGQSPASYMTEHTGFVAQQMFRERGMYPEVMLVNTVHDSLSWQVREDMVDDVLAVLDEANEATADWVASWFRVPLVLEFEMSDGGWGSKEPIAFKAEAHVRK